MKKHSTEQIIRKLREGEVLEAQGKTGAQIERFAQKAKKMRDDLERLYDIPQKVKWQEGDTYIDILKARVGHPKAVRVRIGGETEWATAARVTTTCALVAAC